MKKIKVRNMQSSNGNAIPNQFIIDTVNGKIRQTVFQSYQSVIAVKCFHTGITALDKNTWDYSVTTGKYRNQFLGESIAETRKKIESGEYKLADLN